MREPLKPISDPLELAASVVSKIQSPEEMMTNLKLVAQLDVVVPTLMAICKQFEVTIPCSKPWFHYSAYLNDRHFRLDAKGIRISDIRRYIEPGKVCIVPWPINRLNILHCRKASFEGIHTDQILGNLRAFAEQINSLDEVITGSNLKKEIRKFERKLGITTR